MIYPTSGEKKLLAGRPSILRERRDVGLPEQGAGVAETCVDFVKFQKPFGPGTTFIHRLLSGISAKFQIRLYRDRLIFFS